MDGARDRDRDEARPFAISRRDLLKGAALSSFALFLASCGSTAPPGPSASAGAANPTGNPSRTPGSSPSASILPAPTASPSPSAPTIGLGHKIAGLMIVGFRGSVLTDAPWVRTALAESGLGGVILFDRDQLTGASRNILSPAQVKRLARDLRAVAPA